MAKVEPMFYATVEDGKLLFDSTELFRHQIRSFEGKDVDVIVRKHRKDRTHRQNRYYWSVVVNIAAEHFGYLPEEMHDAYKMLFLRMHEDGKPETTRSTTTMSTIEFNEYVEKCRQWCAEQGVVIPDPETVDY